MRWHIRSQDRTSATDEPNNFNVNLPSHLSQDDIQSVQVEGYIFPNAITNVNSLNNAFFITEDPAGTPSTATITLTAQNYTSGTTLATEIQTQLVASALTSSANYTCVYSEETNKLTIAVTGGATYQISFSNDNTKEEAYKLLGFNKSSTTTDQASTTSTHPIDLGGLASVVIDISAIHDDQYINTGCNEGIFTIPLKHMDWWQSIVKFGSDIDPIPHTHMIRSRAWNIRILYNIAVLTDYESEWELVLDIKFKNR